MHLRARGRIGREVDMGRVCAWCGSLLRAWGVSKAPIGQPICAGCMQELESSLAGAGLKLRKVARAPNGR
jgi:hypothetical protein